MSFLPYKNTPLKSSLIGKLQRVRSLTACVLCLCAASLEVHAE